MPEDKNSAVWKNRTVVYLDEEMVEWFQVEAVRLHCSASEVIRRLAMAEIAKRKDDIWGDKD